MPLLTPTTLRELVDTDLSDTALQLLIDDGEADIARHFGACNPDTNVVTVSHIVGAGDELIFLASPIDDGAVSITRRLQGESVYTSVSAGEFVLDDPWVIRPISGAWRGASIQVTYESKGAIARRRRVLVDLVRLGLRYEAAKSTELGDTTVIHVEYQNERDQLLAGLGSLPESFA